MRNITATELARNLRQVLDDIMITHEEYVIERNHKVIARMVPCPGQQTALEAMADLYRTLPEHIATSWLKDTRMLAGPLDAEIRSPWDS